ncbi:MAG: hypothetical protein LBK23_12200, partial [Oscillospiraceae bacterium]|nr:hypothetical protein [Oscillospiraceae bacterium]
GGYDYIFPSATEKWFQISPDGERWGYVSRDGKTEKFFDDAGQFYGRKAIVKDGEKIYVVDDSFTAISNEITGYDSVASVGDGVFSLRKGDEHFIAVYEGDEPAPAPAAPASVTAVYAAQTAKLVKTSGTTGVSLTTDVSLTAYTIAGNNYIKLRDFALIMDGSSSQFDLSWDGANNAINILYGKPYKAVGGEGAPLKEGNQQAILSTSKILLDGKEVSLTAYTILENNYFKIRDIAQLLGFDVDWRDGGIWVEPEEAYTPD